MYTKENAKYEVAMVRDDGTLCRGGIPTSKSHAQRWANENSCLYPTERFIIVEIEDPKNN